MENLVMTRSKGRTPKGKPNAKAAPIARAATKGVAAGVQFGPTPPKPGSMLKENPATGNGRMR
jgi:hypothetical protein